MRGRKSKRGGEMGGELTSCSDVPVRIAQSSHITTSAYFGRAEHARPEIKRTREKCDLKTNARKKGNGRCTDCSHIRPSCQEQKLRQHFASMISRNQTLREGGELTNCSHGPIHMPRDTPPHQQLFAALRTPCPSIKRTGGGGRELTPCSHAPIEHAEGHINTSANLPSR